MDGENGVSAPTCVLEERRNLAQKGERERAEKVSLGERTGELCFSEGLSLLFV